MIWNLKARRMIRVLYLKRKFLQHNKRRSLKILMNKMNIKLKKNMIIQMKNLLLNNPLKKRRIRKVNQQNNNNKIQS